MAYDKTKDDIGTGLTVAAPALAAVPYVGPFLSAGAAIGGAALKGSAGDMGADQLEELRRQIGSVDPAWFAQNGYNPQQFNPTLVGSYETVQEDPRTREYQMAALAKMQGFASEAGDAQYNAQSRQAMNDANNMAQAREGAIMQNAQARGVGGSGMEMVLRAQADQEGANRASAGGLNAAAQAALMRMQGNQQLLAGSGGVRSQDFNTSSRNADIVNGFNMYNNGLVNDAGRYNNGNNNNAQQFNLNRGDRNSQQAFANRMSVATGQVPVTNALVDQQNMTSNNNHALAINAGVGAGQAAAGLIGSYGSSQKAPSASVSEIDPNDLKLKNPWPGSGR